MNNGHGGVVAHFVSPYLFATGSWVYGQLIHVKHYKLIVLTGERENLDIFPFNPVYSFTSLTNFEKLLVRLRNHGFNDVYYNFFAGILKQQKAILMHCHFGTAGAAFLRVKRKLGLPMVTSFYGADATFVPQNPVWRERYKVLFDEGELFLAEGQHMKKVLVELGCLQEKIRVLHIGVDLNRLSFAPRRMQPDGVVRVLVAGMFREKKGIPYALEAFSRVREKHQRVVLTLVGDSAGLVRDEEEKRRICEILSRPQLKESVNWVGYQPYPVFREMLKSHDILLSPSITSSDGDSEGGSPVSITEAQATGMPVVATYHADIPAVVRHGKSGLLSPERDVDTLAENLGYLVSRPECWVEMGRCGRDHVEREYDSSVQARRLEAIYSEIA